MHLKLKASYTSGLRPHLTQVKPAYNIASEEPLEYQAVSKKKNRHMQVKPAYNIASEEPLLLCDCIFPSDLVNFQASTLNPKPSGLNPQT